MNISQLYDPASQPRPRGCDAQRVSRWRSTSVSEPRGKLKKTVQKGTLKPSFLVARPGVN